MPNTQYPHSWHRRVINASLFPKSSKKLTTPTKDLCQLFLFSILFLAPVQHIYPTSSSQISQPFISTSLDWPKTSYLLFPISTSSCF